MLKNNKEYEYKFNIDDTIEFRNIITKIYDGKIIHKKRKMCHTKYHNPFKIKNCFIRIRDEGNQITLTYKSKIQDKFCDEYEFKINNFLKYILNLPLSIISKKKIYVEKIRETWKINDENCNEIVFDSYPGLKEFVEIECKNEESLNEITKKLDISPIEYDVPDMYHNEYNINKKKLQNIKECKFDNYQNISELINKNKITFDKIIKEQIDLLKSI